ncbi:hypothetical protein M406DRAFT_280694 [Cryphonectria parasitica EP155]|uniref:pH-response regulator protein palC n=1 Tax=Cryphonectria parasitica (strain ATCC 38755 / EP155) TaxID=660469 RepID=A0A9P5CLT8_CRYP1|nr:uncharacterized protein M406DRAFT_280694 [Cryphonectria parasitica EP155]KAF3762557.1 hypothetical protein M406DRAFT_280694 [Cryphonectria parasitica EP155]
MPYPFVLPTTSAFSYSSSFTCDSHPSLPLTVSTHRGVVRDVLKKHKRLSPSSQAANLPSVLSALTAYLPYLLAVDAGLAHRTIGDGSELFSIIQRASPPLSISWRPTLSDVPVPGRREGARVRVQGLEHEVAFVLATRGYASTLLARAALQPLYSTTTSLDLYAVGAPDRQIAISAATKHLLDAASVYDYLARRAEQPQPGPPHAVPCADISAPTARAQSHLALAEATLLAVLKDDPYPAIVSQDRNRNDKEWMYKAPDVPKVRAHLFARLCLAAAEHAAKAHSLSGPGTGGGKLNDGFVRYLEDLRRTSRAKACRFFGIDAELGGQAGDAIGWLHAGLQEMGVEVRDSSKKPSGLSRLKKEWTEKREDRRVDKGTTWGADAGRLEETRVIEMLEAKWSKQNDTMFTQAITPAGTLLAQMPSAREIHTLKPYEVPVLDSRTLEAMRAPPERHDDFGDEQSSDDETLVPGSAPGAYPGTPSSYY